MHYCGEANREPHWPSCAGRLFRVGERKTPSSSRSMIRSRSSFSTKNCAGWIRGPSNSPPQPRLTPSAAREAGSSWPPYRYGAAPNRQGGVVRIPTRRRPASLHANCERRVPCDRNVSVTCRSASRKCFCMMTCDGHGGGEQRIEKCHVGWFALHQPCIGSFVATEAAY